MKIANPPPSRFRSVLADPSLVCIYLANSVDLQSAIVRFMFNLFRDVDDKTGMKDKNEHKTSKGESAKGPRENKARKRVRCKNGNAATVVQPEIVTYSLFS